MTAQRLHYGALCLVLMAGMWMFLQRLEHRTRFALRVTVGAVAVAAVLTATERCRASWVLWMLAVYAALTALALFCCAIRFSTALYIAAWTLMTQQFLLQLTALASRLLRTLGASALLAGTLQLAALAALQLVLYFTLMKALPENGHCSIGPRQLISALLLLMVFCLLGSRITLSVNRIVLSGFGGFCLMGELYCITVLYLQDALFKKSAMRQELSTLNLLWHQQKEQYNLAKENIALINHKCHDLKHQVRALRDMPDSGERAKYLDEIDDSIRIYEAVVKTGSEVLDTILTEKSLRCNKEQIKINCVADGSRMGFLDPVDIYTIFGNALDNAIEEVQKLDDPEKRQIDVTIHVQQQFLILNIANPLDMPLRFADGLPVTTKGDNGYHGFGLKSVRHTVQKYGGCMTVGTECGCFALKILIPLPDGAK